MRAARLPRRWTRLPFWRTVLLLAGRQVKQSRGVLIKRDEIAFMVLSGLLTGLIFWQSAGTAAGHGALFFFVAHMTWWPGFLYMFSFPAETAVLTKELLSDSYSIEAYLCSKVLADTPAEMVCPSIYFAIALPMVGFKAQGAVLMWLSMLLQFQTMMS